MPALFRFAVRNGEHRYAKTRRAGIVGQLTDSTSLFFVADYSRGVSGEKLRVLQGNAGWRINW
jgi:hypothetical protein